MFEALQGVFLSFANWLLAHPFVMWSVLIVVVVGRPEFVVPFFRLFKKPTDPRHDGANDSQADKSAHECEELLLGRGCYADGSQHKGEKDHPEKRVREFE
jgi:hypothetical protein